MGKIATLSDQEVYFGIEVRKKGGIRVEHVMKDVQTIQVHILDAEPRVTTSRMETFPRLAL